MQKHKSKDELLYQNAVDGDVEGVKALARQGAGLEWRDEEGRTPLIVASMNPRLYHVTKTLVEMGSNVNAHCSRSCATPSHHAAKSGSHQTVALLLSHGANVLALDDNHQTPLDVARTTGYNIVVRAIEAHVCYFSGLLREILAPGLLETLPPRLISRECWAVILPSRKQDPSTPSMLELVIYRTEQDPQPRLIIPLWSSTTEDPRFYMPDPVLMIFNQDANIRYKFASAIEGDKLQIRQLHNACKGMSQVVYSPILCTDPGPSTSAGPSSSSSTRRWWRPESNATQAQETHDCLDHVPRTPSAPPLPDEDWGISYPTVDSSPVDLSSPELQNKADTSSEPIDSSCVICWERPIEGACVPCGHMAACMTCLDDIKNEKGDCPVCRAKIDQIIKIYTSSR